MNKKNTFIKLLLVTVLVLAYPTYHFASSVLTAWDKIWLEQGRAYDVKTEYFLHRHAKNELLNEYNVGKNPDSIKAHLLRLVMNWAYHSALDEIPANDIERSVYTYEHKINPQIALAKNSNLTPTKDDVGHLVLRILHDANNQVMHSDYTRDVEFHRLVTLTTGLYDIHGEEWFGKEEYRKNLPNVLRLSHQSLISLNPEEVYNKYSLNEEVVGVIFYALLTDYFIQRKNILHKSGCNQNIANNWLETRALVNNLIIASNEWRPRFQQYISQAQLEGFIATFQKEEPAVMRTINENCN